MRRPAVSTTPFSAASFSELALAGAAGDSTDMLKGAAAGLVAGAVLCHNLSCPFICPKEIASTETEPGLYHYLPDQV